ncbi:hypothetical protein [Rhizohabitans arisaemae]|uniref:hypothetical protein n=1 Tax=Rhizohabitans arisaemae TaxID=2720610 RepID=UPI0024B24A26|nr:hypothetical protein [Rhizohabitans arisaemae]
MQHASTSHVGWKVDLFRSSATALYRLDTGPFPVRRARQLVRDVLVERWGFDPSDVLVSDAVTAVSELATNAERYGKTPFLLLVTAFPAGEGSGAWVRVGVYDARSRRPRRRYWWRWWGWWRERGRGLDVVEGLGVLSVIRRPFGGRGKIVVVTVGAGRRVAGAV